jgi:hypothetical protein
MIEQVKTLANLVKRLYRKPVYGSSVREEKIPVGGKLIEVENFIFYTTYPYSISNAIVITCEKDKIGEKINELGNYCNERDLIVANILRYCRENRIDVPTDCLDHLERTGPEILKKILKNLEKDLADLQIASSKKRCLVLHYTTSPTGENVVCGGGITLYPIPSNKPEEILPPEKLEKLRRMAPWEQEARADEIKELLDGLEEEEYPGYDFEIKD